MRAIEFCFPVSANDQNASVAQLTQQVTEQPKRSAVGPVEIVSVEQQSLASGQISKHARHGVEEKQALFLRRQFMTLWYRPQTLFDFRSQLVDLRTGIAVSHWQIIIVMFANPATKGFNIRKVWCSRFIFVATTAQHPCAFYGRLDRHLARKPRLAGAGFAT